MNKTTPKSASRVIDHQFETAPFGNTISVQQQSAFDKLRVASNLMVASVLISVALIIVELIIWDGSFAKIVLPLIVIVIIIYSQFFFKKKAKIEEDTEDEEMADLNENDTNIVEKCNRNTVKAIISTSKAYFLCFEGFFNNDKQQLKSAMLEVDDFNSNAKQLKNNVFKSIQKLQQDQIETGHYYVQIVDYLREMAHSINYVVKPVYTHFENKHKPFSEEQIAQFNDFAIELNNFFNYSLHLLKEKRFDDLEELIEKRDLLVEKLKTLEKNQIKRIKNNSVSTRNSVLYLNIISETKSLLLNLINVVKAQRDFVNETRLNSDKSLR